MTFSEYKNFRAPAGFRDEFIHGNIVLSPSPDRRHADLCATLYDLLKPRLKKQFVVRLDTTHHLGEREGPRPDVFVIDRERWVAADETGGFPEGSPELAIEVLSPSNSLEEMRVKRELYFSDPRCLAVWEIDPAAFKVTCWDREGTGVYDRDAHIAVPEQLGSGVLPIRAIFDGIEHR